MSRNRRAPITSQSETVRTLAAATREIQPPANVPLDPRDLPFFRSVVEEFARSEWTDHQLELAAMLARTMADLEQEQRELRKEGSVIQNARGTDVMNPRRTVIQMNAQAILGLRRSLSLNATGRTGGTNKDIANRRRLAKEIEKDNPLESPLLARPPADFN